MVILPLTASLRGAPLAAVGSVVYPHQAEALWGSGVAGLGAEVAIGAQIAQQLGQQNQQQAAPAPNDGLEDRFCTKCRKMVRGNFCPYCGTPTV